MKVNFNSIQIPSLQRIMTQDYQMQNVTWSTKTSSGPDWPTRSRPSWIVGKGSQVFFRVHLKDVGKKFLNKIKNKQCRDLVPDCLQLQGQSLHVTLAKQKSAIYLLRLVSSRWGQHRMRRFGCRARHWRAGNTKHTVKRKARLGETHTQPWAAFCQKSNTSSGVEHRCFRP